ncbi:NAD-dependent epimerase/dehydratase family protein [Candidatus Acetothermia bacterium]|nr:NAD-dependent epimerase/dehydratase family protein [Candidatus Acetothermia bacterium]
MRVLILGGTQFIGRQIVKTLLTAGHTVSILTRGKSADELPVEVERLRGDRDEGAPGLKALKGRSWDVCIDVCGYTPRQVRPSAEMLRAIVKRYVFVSAVSVYGDPQHRPVFETHPRMLPASEDVTEIDADTYGPLKVACEDIVQQIYADRCTLLRPQIVVGSHDARARYQYWVQRAMQGGEMLAPGDGYDHLQVIDVRDLARFTRTVIENDLGGAFNLAGPRLTWAEFMMVLGAKNIVWVSAEIIKAAGVTEFELPLFRQERGARSSLMDVSNERARAAGLTLTGPEVTMRDMQAWILGRNLTPAFSPERETELIRIARRDGVQSQKPLNPT